MDARRARTQIHTNTRTHARTVPRCAHELVKCVMAQRANLFISVCAHLRALVCGGDRRPWCPASRYRLGLAWARFPPPTRWAPLTCPMETVPSALPAFLARPGPTASSAPSSSPPSGSPLRCAMPSSPCRLATTSWNLAFPLHASRETSQHVKKSSAALSDQREEIYTHHPLVPLLFFKTN